ncbi:MAG: penicillin-binding transpeptidase domain-containing protein [Clostridiaceae bacterium]|nr:penicillin-binding transpeptidase domain-containing protein [Clostridiaceae bacterium]
MQRRDQKQELHRRLIREDQHRQRQRTVSNGKPQRVTRPSGGQPVGRKPNRRPGIVFFSICLLLFAAVLVWQLYQIQIVNHAANAELAAKQHYSKKTENPRRGLILDRNDVELAGTTYVYRIGVTPKDMRSITKNISSAEIASSIAECLNMDTATVAAAMAQTDATYIQLKKDVAKEEADKLKAYIDDADLGGVRIDTEPRRYYTNGTLASQVIGYTNYSNEQLIGQLGIELQYNTLLTGQPGYTYVETDNYSSKGTLPFSVPTSLRAKNGQNIVLNIDINIQKIAQEELANAISLYDITSGGTVIIMNPYTGAILAMASYPYFSSSDPAACPEGVDASTWDTGKKETIDYLSSQIWRNRAISDTYEPGSTFKAITASMALEEDLAIETEMMSDAPLQVGGWTIHCSSGAGHGAESMQQGFWRSCNPIFAQLAQRVGVDRFYAYLRSFGFMGVTGIDLPAEGTGILHQNPTEVDMVTLSYGESSTVTPIQLITSYCAFANGGNLIKPSIVKEITDSDGNIVKEIQPETVRKVLSENTTARIRELLKGVVLNGTGSAAYIEGYSIAGKTSTSTDDNGDHTLSFCGMAPANSPEIVALVVLNKPQDKKTGSKGAAKTCGQVIARTLEYMGVSREYNDTDVSRINATVAVPNVVGLTYAQAMKELANRGLSAEAGDKAMGDATLVKYQWPAADTELHNKGLVILYPVETPQEEEMAIPDFTGKTVHECLSSAAESGLNIRISGDCLGEAVSQDPAPTYGRSGQTAAPTAQPTPGTSESSAGAGGTTEPAGGTPATDPAVTHLKRGSVITVVFAAIEEEVAQSGETE